ncbi:myosin-11-like [Leguminivora glycinivorella]|uniref:myosin-11-like n=1 Tax=Leguminivora glycinivorella TaxID=1035111 RepID=UPI00200C9F41|nr:myosin-11-like [Leguminivora glycinivorella]
MEAKSGIEDSELGKVRILTMNGWSPHDLLMLVQETTGQKRSDGSGLLASAAVEGIKYDLFSIPKEVADLGNDILTRRLKVLEYFRKRTSDVKIKNEFDAETEVIHKLISDTSKRLEDKIRRVMNIARASWKDRDELSKKINQLTRELATYTSQTNISNTTVGTKDIGNKVSSVKFDISNTDLREKLNKERAARESLKHMVATAEGLLRTARARITVLERELKTTQKQMQESARKQKETELLHRSRQASYGVRSKKLLEESKTGEVTIEMLTFQRNALELRVTELQEQIKAITEENEARVVKLEQEIQRLQEELDAQEKHRTGAEACVIELEKRIKDIHDEYRLLLEQSDKLVKMSNDKCLDFLPRKENEPSLTEAELWKDLDATKKKLEQVTAELRQSREDKESLLNSLAKIAQEGSEHNMANELLLREQTNFRLQQTIEEQKESIKAMSKKLAQKERQIIALNMEASRTDYECCSHSKHENHELALEVVELSSQVAKLTRERESLVTAAMSRALMLERHERCADLFAQVTRARRGLVAQMESQERERERPRSEPDAKLTGSLTPACLKAAETWTELRMDRERVQQLQELVASQNLQLKRERRVRNHLEQRRAILERLFLNQSTNSKPYVPAEKVASYLGTSSYLTKDAFPPDS